MNNTYWKGLDEKHQTPEFVEKSTKEFQEDLTIDEFVGGEGVENFKTGRRDFLKFLGFGVAAATLASCEAPVIKSIPYVNKPEDITPGVANWYASTFYDGNDFANILVKTREGRPIWIKGNSSFGSSKGGLTPRIAASVLNLYNGERLAGAQSGGNDVAWADADATISSELKSIANSGGKVRILSNTIASPSTQMAIDALVKSLGGEVKAPMAPVAPVADAIDGAVDEAAVAAVAAGTGVDAEIVEEAVASGSNDVAHVQYDAVSYSAMRKANKENFKEAIIPSYDFTRARSIVSIDADFLSNWILSAEYSQAYTQTRKPENGWMSRHFHFEAVMSLTGANADYRKATKPSEYGAVAAAILKHVGGESVAYELDPAVEEMAIKAAEHLKANMGQSLVVSGSNDKSVQLLVNAINHELKNYGKTIDLNTPLEIKKADDAQVEELVNEVIAGKVDAVIVYGCNPVYSLPNGAAFGEALAGVKLSVAMSEYADETASKCTYICPDHNYLEAWNDYNPKAGEYTIQQPVIRPLGDTRQAQESFLVWAGDAKRDGRESQVYYDFIRGLWEQYGFPMQQEHLLFEDYWNWAVHNGSVAAMPVPSKGLSYSDATSSVKLGGAFEGKYEVVAYQTGEIGEGQYSANPWLQELPNAITKVCWDNYVTMAPSDCMEEFGVSNDPANPISGWKGLYLGQEDPAYVVEVTVGEEKLKLPVYPLPGQAKGTIGIALGYGRGAGDEKIGKAAYQVELNQSGEYIMDGDKRMPIGGNAFRFTSFTNEQLTYAAGAGVTVLAEKYNLATTQTHHTIMGRTSALRETTLDTFLAGDKDAYNPAHELHIHTKGHGEHVNVSEIDLWAEHPVENVGHRWGLSIDLTACNGCGVCIVACHSENNVPVVGKDEIRRARDMHWLRMDRYFTSVDDGNRARWNDDRRSEEEDHQWSYDSLEVPEAEPRVAFMPMMCQHCNHAPCETVCPVAATTHSNEGLNMMAYNRCIGTRYCGNNCPYKVRRFNWFNYRDYKKFNKVNPTHDEMARLVLNPDVTVRSRGVMEKCTFCVQRIQEGKLNAKVEGRALIDGDVVSACADACPSGALKFGDLNDSRSAVKEASEEDRTYVALQEVGTQPNVSYKVKVRNMDELYAAGEVAHAEEDHGHNEEEAHGEH